MLRTLGIFVAERFRLSVSLPLAFVLGAASAGQPWDGSCLRLAICVWLLLFSARAVDDLADLPLDRLRKPERALPAGRITTCKLAWLAGLGLATAVLLLGYHSLAAALAAALNASLVLGFYWVRARLPRALHPLLVNSPFLLVMLLGPIERSQLTVEGSLLAVFVWLSVVGHDFSHGIEETPSPQPSAKLTPQAQARWGLAFFAGASLIGGWVAWHARDAFFAIVLGSTSIWMAVLLWGLLRNSSDRAARRIYVPGFLFFLLPLIARIAAAWLKAFPWA